LKNTNRGGGSEYLFHEYDNSEWDTGTYSLQCGRRAHGTEGLIQRTEHLFDLAEYARLIVEKNPRFKFVSSNYLNLCFQVVPFRSKMDVNTFTLNVRKSLVKEGKSLVNYAKRSDGTIFFRLVFLNHQTQSLHIDELMQSILEIADGLDV
jgi:hypothetical protein